MRAITAALVVGLLSYSSAPIAPAHAQAQIQSLPTYKVFSEDASAGRRVVAVRIDHRITEAEVSRIAEAVKSRGRAQAARTQVNFYLNGVRAGDGAWASATYGPDLKIVVNGLTAEEEQAFAAEVENDHRNVVGAWLTGAPAVPGRLMIFREKNRLFAEWRVRGGHRTVDEVVESRGSRGHRFDIPGDDSQYYVMLPGGALELRDKTALIAVAERIPLAKDRGRLAQRGLGIAGALAAKQDRAKAAVAAARARTATPAPSQPAVTVTQQTSAQAPPDAASPVAAFVSVAPKGIVPSPSIAETKAPVAPSEVAAASVAEGPAAAPQTVAPKPRKFVHRAPSRQRQASVAKDTSTGALVAARLSNH